MKLGETVKNHDSKRVPLKQSDRAAKIGTYPYYGASGVIDHIDEYIFDGDYLLIGEDGANLLARSTPIAFHATGKFWVNNHAHIMSFNGKADLGFLAYYINSISLKPYVTGSAQPKLNRSKLDSIKIPLPPLKEQKRIAAILDKADAIRRKRQQAIKLADDFLRSVFLDMFGDPVTNPKGWDVKSIGEFLTIKNGYAFKSEYFCENGENVLLTPGNFYESGGYRCRGEKQKRYSGPVPDGFTLKAGDILLAMTEQAEGLLGSSMVVPSGGVYLHNQRLGLLDFDQCSVGSTFLAHLFNVGSVRKCIHSSATGLKVRHTSTKKIEAIEVGFPKYSMQVEFSKVEKKIRSASAVMSGNVELLENNFYSLNQKAFSGNL